ncbi:MAG: hypothetical protein PHE53_04835 [Thermoguttaceae bacterium]|nr:hypothetical protein [Thermoguttaceae bacterium]
MTLFESRDPFLSTSRTTRRSFVRTTWMGGVVWSLTSIGGLPMGTLTAKAAESTPSRGTETTSTPSSELLPEWQAEWNAPAAVDRPLQIVHGGNFSEAVGKNAANDAQKAAGLPEQPVDGIRPSILEFVENYQSLGLGGLVLNTPFGAEYLRNAEAWNRVRDAVEACRRLGMIVWIYDEDGYPSGTAGTLVYDTNPDFQSQEMVYDRNATESPFTVRDSYEFTHATNNYASNRRYVNLLDDRACQTFVELTHQAYAQHLAEYFADGTIAAFFTDEPSLLAVDLGQLPESIRNNVRKIHPIDPNKKQYPAVPWVADMPEQYAAHYGEPLDQAAMRSLFEGDSERDREVRRRYWALCAELLSNRYFGCIQTFCQTHGVESSGHCLWEELPLFHPALCGNILTQLRRYSLPGLDELSSQPMVAVWGGWSAAAFPASAAALNGTRRVMTEISDHSERMGDAKKPAPLSWMKAAAAWQAAMGVTEFTLYYSPADRTPDEYRAYCEYVGRLNAILKLAIPVYETLLYYPIEDVSEEYRPVAAKPSYENQSPRMQRLVTSYMRLGERLTRSQTPFCVVDRAALEANMGVTTDGRLQVGQNGRIAARSLVIPSDVRLPDSIQTIVDAFEKAGGTVLRDGSDQAKVVLDQSKEDGVTIAQLASTTSPERLTPPSHDIVHGRFLRDDRTVYIWVNISETPYTGTFTYRLVSDVGSSTPNASVVKAWSVLNPDDGSIEFIEPTDGQLPLQLGAHQTRLFVSP